MAYAKVVTNLLAMTSLRTANDDVNINQAG